MAQASGLDFAVPNARFMSVGLLRFYANAETPRDIAAEQVAEVSSSGGVKPCPNLFVFSVKPLGKNEFEVDVALQVQQQNQGQDRQNQQAGPVQMSGGKGGGQGKGEQKFTGKPEYKPGQPGKAPKGWRWDPEKKVWWHKNPQTGKREDKPRGWSPTTAQKVGVGATIATGAVILGRAIAACFGSGLCEIAGAPAGI